jgi:hypothetical protein
MKQKIIAELEKQAKLACSGVVKPIKDLQTQTGVAEPYGRCVETQPHAGFGFSLIYYHFTCIICLASKYVPTAPANHHPMSYAHPCEPVWPSGQISCPLVFSFDLRNLDCMHSACKTHRHHGFTRNPSCAHFYDLRLYSHSTSLSYYLYPHLTVSSTFFLF